MKKQIIVAFVALFAMTFVACTSGKDRCINNLEKLVVNAENNGQNFTEAQWEKSIDRF